MYIKLIVAINILSVLLNGYFVSQMPFGARTSAGGDSVTSSTIQSAGGVIGPGSSSDNAFVRFDGTTGKLVQNSAYSLSDAGVVSGTVQFGTGISIADDANIFFGNDSDITGLFRSSFNRLEYTMPNGSTEIRYNVTSEDGIGLRWYDTYGSEFFRLTSGYGYLEEAPSILLGAGSSTTIGFYGVSPVEQYATTTFTETFVVNGGTAARASSTWTGGVGTTPISVGDIVRALKNYGLLPN